MRQCDTFSFNNFSKRFHGLFRICCDFIQVFFFFAFLLPFLGYVCEVGGWVQALDSHRIAWTLYLTLGSLGIANAKSCNLWSQDTLPFSVSLSLFVNNYFVYIAHLLYLSINLSQGHSIFFPIGYLLLFFPTCSLLSPPPDSHYVFLSLLEVSCLVFHL